jgi:MFS family permease
MTDMSFLFGLTVTASLLYVGHWFPWPQRLHRLAAYIYGVASILIGAAIWLIPSGGWLTWLGLAAFAVSGGLATGSAWFADYVLNLRIKAALLDDRTPKRP